MVFAGIPTDTRRTPNADAVVVPQLGPTTNIWPQAITSSTTTARHPPIPPYNTKYPTYLLETSPTWPQNSAPPPQPAPQLRPRLPRPQQQHPPAQAKQTTQTPPPLRKESGINTSPRHPSEPSSSTPSSPFSSSSVPCNSSTWSWLETLYVLNSSRSHIATPPNISVQHMQFTRDIQLENVLLTLAIHSLSTPSSQASAQQSANSSSQPRCASRQTRRTRRTLKTFRMSGRLRISSLGVCCCTSFVSTLLTEGGGLRCWKEKTGQGMSTKTGGCETQRHLCKGRRDYKREDQELDICKNTRDVDKARVALVWAVAY
jgi:hypothetical protein